MANYIPIQGYEMPDGSTNVLGRLLGYEAFSADNESIGTIDNVWLDDTYQQGFVAITTGWLFGRQCLIPTDALQVDHDMRRLTLPYTKDKIKQSPNVAEDYEVTTAEAQDVREYYGLDAVSNTQSSVGDMSVSVGDVVGGVAGNTIGNEVDDTVDRVRGVSTRADIDDDDMDDVDDVDIVDDVEVNTPQGLGTRDTANRLERDTTEIPLSEESVKVGKREVQAGTVRLRKVVRTETVNVPVELRREDVEIERVSPTDTTQTGNEFVEGEIDIPLTREEPVVEKTSQVTGAVRVSKVADSEQQNVSETVRKEDVEVERSGEAGETTAEKVVPKKSRARKSK